MRGPPFSYVDAERVTREREVSGRHYAGSGTLLE
jgi:hypothetical protein